MPPSTRSSFRGTAGEAGLGKATFPRPQAEVNRCRPISCGPVIGYFLKWYSILHSRTVSGPFIGPGSAGLTYPYGILSLAIARLYLLNTSFLYPPYLVRCIRLPVFPLTDCLQSCVMTRRRVGPHRSHQSLPGSCTPGSF